MNILNLEGFLKKYNKKNIMNQSDLQRVYNHPIFPRDLEIYSDKGFVKIHNGSKGGGSQWTCFIIKEKINLLRLIW